MYDVAIIGAGPAGASAGLFTAKAGKKTILFDSGKSITAKAWVENHYGVDAIEGPKLLEEGQKQAQKFGAEIVKQEVTKVSEENGALYEIETAEGKYHAEHVVFATGMSVKAAQDLGLEIIDGKEPRVAKIIKVDETGHTSLPKVWAAGTVAGVSVHTIITSGDGAKVAINIISQLNGKRYVDHDVMKK
ncbi:FAD-dependent oxidoreductase [Halobacillus litoralis]|uniref:FAD-dependent oxidoreductase n=1 Tax=Halobacillus litoralis TaxID=45668 RepID=UPI001CFD4E97|nr:FAD-dependent oxidoreductase [Halobacillus litoralis]